MKNQPKRKGKKLLCPKAGTATSSPTDKTASQSNMNIVNVSLFEDTSTWIPIVCETYEEIKQAIQDRLHTRMPSKRKNILQKTA
jgi:hypothetical protein